MRSTGCPTAATRLKLNRDARIASFEPDRLVHTMAQTLPTGVDRIQVDQLLPGVVNDGVQVSVDVDIAIIDTGVAPNHADLNVYAAGSRNFARTSADWYDRNGHGTHVAGTAAAIDNTIGVVGVAPGADLGTQSRSGTTARATSRTSSTQSTTSPLTRVRSKSPT